MVTLKGNLGDRHKQLNEHIVKTGKQFEKFEDVQNIEEKSDIDKFIKIDLCSKYLNIDYIVNVLKGGDSLYITRALKSSWIYNDENSHVMNPSFLQENVFPDMSVKMRKKMLTSMSMYIKNPERAAKFIKCCMDVQLPNVALKFAIHTTDMVKVEFLKENSHLLEASRSKTFLKHFIGTSFSLADTLLSSIHSELNKVKVLYNLRHLYALSDLTYLAMLERYVELTPYNNPKRLGSAITKHIMKNHKTRVFDTLSIYINFLHMKTVAKCITPSDAKTIVFDLQPKSAKEFWDQNFCVHYGVILYKIPVRNRYQLIKSMFNYKYPHHEFEKNIQFYEGQCYKFMPEKERYYWVQDQIENHREFHGSGEHYKWYLCLTFNKAFEEITNLIKLTNRFEGKTELILILLKTVENQRHIWRLLKYYYQNHNNDPSHIQEFFIKELLRLHNGYDFNIDCWATLDKIFTSLRVYDLTYDSPVILDFRITALMYYILNELELPEELKMFASNYDYLFSLQTFTSTLSSNRKERVFKYLFNFYLSEIEDFDPKKQQTSVIQKYLNYMLDLLSFYGRTKDDIPETVMHYLRLDWADMGTHRLFRVPIEPVTEVELMRLLKVDAKLVVEKLPCVKRAHEMNNKFSVGQFLKKIKVYFSDEITSQYLEFYRNWLAENPLSKSCTEAVTYAIFLLGDESVKINFMNQNAPIHDRIKRNKARSKNIVVQRAICATVFYSRPSVPLQYILMYVRGQYIRSCLTLITYYLINLPLSLGLEFFEAILKTRPLAQRHGVRIAFACFTIELLKKLIVHIWKSNRNISLRMILYKTLYNKIAKEKKYALFETLITFTSDLDENDRDIFKILVYPGSLPEHLISDYMNAVWIAVNSLPSTSINIKRRSDVIEYFCTIFYSLRQEHVRPIIEDFIEDLFDVLQAKMYQVDDDTFYLHNKKWELAAKFITYVRNENDLYIKKELAQLITAECLGVFNVSDGTKYIGRDLFIKFLRHLQKESYLHPIVCYGHINVIMEKVLETLKYAMPIEQIYFILWEIHMDIAVRKAVTDIKIHCAGVMDVIEKLTAVRNAVLHFGTYIGNVIKDQVDNDKYPRNLAPFIENEMGSRVEKIVNLVDDIRTNDVMIITSLALIEFTIPETHLFALLLIPAEYKGCFIDDYNKVLNAIKNCNNMEVITFMFQKFVNTDFKPRDFLKL